MLRLVKIIDIRNNTCYNIAIQQKKGLYVEIGLIKGDDIVNAVLMPVSSLVKIDKDRVLLQMDTNVVGSCARSQLQKVLDYLYPDEENGSKTLCISDGEVLFEGEGYIGSECYFKSENIEDISLKYQNSCQLTFLINIDSLHNIEG